MENEQKPENENKGTSEVTYTQSQVDQMISKAISTREANLNQTWQARIAEIEAKHQEAAKGLTDQVNSLRLQSETTKMLMDKGLTNLSGLFDADLSTVEGRASMLDNISKAMANAAKQNVAEATKQKLPVTGSTTVVTPDQMSPEQYREYRKSLGIR